MYADDKTALGFYCEFLQVCHCIYILSSSAYFNRIYIFFSSHANIFGIHKMNSSRPYTLPLKQKFFLDLFFKNESFGTWSMVFFFFLFAGRRHRGSCRWHTHTCIQSFVGKVRKIKENWIHLQNYRKSKSTSGSLHDVEAYCAGRNVTFGTKDT
jgi:hypothetical protein